MSQTRPFPEDGEQTRLMHSVETGPLPADDLWSPDQSVLPTSDLGRVPSALRTPNPPDNPHPPMWADDGPATADVPQFGAKPPSLLNDQTIALPYLPVIDEPESFDRTRLALAGGAGLALLLVGWLLVSILGKTGSPTDRVGATASTSLANTEQDNVVDRDADLAIDGSASAAAALAPLAPAAMDLTDGDTGDTPLDRDGSGGDRSGNDEDSDVDDTGDAAAPSTTAASTTTTRWTEPPLPPESQWINAGHGVAVPDLLLRIRFCESTNNYDAANSYSTARGAYQFLKGSWEWYGHAKITGAAEAHLATPAQQDAAALRTLQRSGTQPWLASRGCWADPDINPRYATAGPSTTTTTSSTKTTSTTTDTSVADTSTSTTTDPSDTTAPPSTNSTSGPSTTRPSTTVAPTSTTTNADTSSTTPEGDQTTTTVSGSTTTSDDGQTTTTPPEEATTTTEARVTSTSAAPTTDADKSGSV